MVLFSSWSNDILAIIKPDEWLSESEIHRRVVNRRLGKIGFGPVTWLVSLISTPFAESLYRAVTIDRTLWHLCLLTHSKELYVRETAVPSVNVVTVVEAPHFEYCLGAGGTTKTTKTSRNETFNENPNLAFA